MAKFQNITLTTPSGVKRTCVTQPKSSVLTKNDPFFLQAEAFKRDIPQAVVRSLNTGHFALETYAREIAESIRDFLK